MNPTNTTGALRPVGDLIREAFRFTKKHINILALIAAVPFVFSTIATIVGSGNPGILLAIIAGILLIVGVILNLMYPLVIFRAIDSISTGGMALGVVEGYKNSARLLIQYLWISVLSFFIIVGSFGLLFVPGIFVSILIVFSTLFYLFDGKRGLSALISSTTLIYGRFWNLFFKLLVGCVIVFVIMAIVNLVFNAILPTMLASILINLVMSIFVNPFGLVFMYLIYKDLKAVPQTAITCREFVVKKWYIALGVLGILFAIAGVGFGISFITNGILGI